MGRDFEITKDDVAATKSRVAAEEAAIVAEAERQARINDPNKDVTDPDNFNISPDRPLPEGFVNPPCGEPGHFCVDNRGFYQPDWWQLHIDKVHDKQANPQAFNLAGQIVRVPLETWVDVHPAVIIALQDAVEVFHEHEAKAGDIIAGIPTVHKETKRKRFHWDKYPSAKIGRK